MMFRTLKQVRRCVVIGTGQIGTFAIRGLEEAGWSVTAADIEPSTGFVRRFAHSDCTIHSLDVTSLAEVMEFFEIVGPCQAVIFAAGLTGQKAVAAPKVALEVLLQGTDSIVAAMQHQGIPRLVGVSSLAVYDTNNNIAEPLNETAKQNGIVGTYGTIIRRMEAKMASLVGLSVVILRVAGVFGPNRYGHGSHSSQLIEKLLYSASQSSPVTLRGHWDDRDDFIYCRDVGNALATAAEMKSDGLEIINVGTGQTTNLVELVETIRNVIGHFEVNLVPPFPSRRPLSRQPLDIARMVERIGPVKFPLAKAVHDFVREANLLPQHSG